MLATGVVVVVVVVVAGVVLAVVVDVALDPQSGTLAAQSQV